MSTPTIEQIHRHCSVRAYTSEPVPRSMVREIVAAGQRSSTSSNLQLYSVVAVTEAETRDELARLCGDQEHIRQAPVFLAWCADASRLARVCAARGYQQVTDHVENFLVAAVDVAILMQTATLAAESMQLGMCYIGGIRNDLQAVIDLLQLPKLVVPISGMTLGWPASQPTQRPRLATEAILHWERYSTDGEEELLAEYDRAMVETGIYNNRQVPVPGRPSSVEEYGWQEHSARRAAAGGRAGMGAVIRGHGFALN